MSSPCCRHKSFHGSSKTCDMAAETGDDHSSCWSQCILYDSFPAFLRLQVLFLQGVAFIRFNEISNRLRVAKMPEFTA